MKSVHIFIEIPRKGVIQKTDRRSEVSALALPMRKLPIKPTPTIMLPMKPALPQAPIQLSLRRLPGDRLSTSKSESVPRNPPPTTTAAAAAGHVLSASLFAIASGTGNTPPRANGTIPVRSVVPAKAVTAPKQLKPWTKSYSTKTPQICAQMLRSLSLFSLHKCMAPSCSFTSSNNDLALAHWRTHDDHNRADAAHTIRSADVVPTWHLECAYCDMMADSAEHLVRHTVAEHQTSIYVCPYCFYRSVAAFNVLQHQMRMHDNVTADMAKVLVAPGPAKKLLVELLHIHVWRSLHVTPLQSMCGEFVPVTIARMFAHR